MLNVLIYPYNYFGCIQMSFNLLNILAIFKCKIAVCILASNKYRCDHLQNGLRYTI